jgi:hypothetical protein
LKRFKWASPLGTVLAHRRLELAHSATHAGHSHARHCPGHRACTDSAPATVVLRHSPAALILFDCPVEAKNELFSSLRSPSCPLLLLAHEANVEHFCSSRHCHAQPSQRPQELLSPPTVLLSVGEAVGQHNHATTRTGHFILCIELTVDSLLRLPFRLSIAAGSSCCILVRR